MDWLTALGTIGRGIAAYVVLVIYIRISGNRTLAKLRAFDFVVTIALGSVLASMVIVASTPVLQGILAMAILIFLQWLVATLSVHNKWFERLVTNEAILLYKSNAWDDRAMSKARLTRAEVESAMRAAGHAEASTVESVWLEVNGDLSVTPLRAASPSSA